MENNLIYTTKPRLLGLSVSFFGCIISSLISRFIYISIHTEHGYLTLGLVGVFALLALFCLGCFFSMRVVKLKRDSLVFSYWLLPIKRTVPLTEVTKMTQSVKEVKYNYQFNFSSKSNIYSIIFVTSVFTFTNKREIKMNSISVLDFSNLQNLFGRIKRGSTKAKAPRGGILVYLLDNFESLLITFGLLVVTLGLVYDILL